MSERERERSLIPVQRCGHQMKRPLRVWHSHAHIVAPYLKFHCHNIIVSLEQCFKSLPQPAGELWPLAALLPQCDIALLRWHTENTQKEVLQGSPVCRGSFPDTHDWCWSSTVKTWKYLSTVFGLLERKHAGFQRDQARSLDTNLRNDFGFRWFCQSITAGLTDPAPANGTTT